MHYQSFQSASELLADLSFPRSVTDLRSTLLSDAAEARKSKYLVAAEDSLKSTPFEMGNVIEGTYRLAYLIQSSQYTQLAVAFTPEHEAVLVKFLNPFNHCHNAKRLFEHAMASRQHLKSMFFSEVLSSGYHRKYPYFVTEFVYGTSLESVIETHKQPLPAAHLPEIGAQLCDCLWPLHAGGYVHRDIKPSNILISKKGLTIIDFELIWSREMFRNHYEGTGSTAGTPRYMSPEQVKNEELDQRSDIYSIGCTLYNLATRSHPFDGIFTDHIFEQHIHEQPPKISETINGFPPEIEEIIQKCLMKDPADRFQSVLELRNSFVNLSCKLAEGTAILLPWDFP